MTNGIYLNDAGPVVFKHFNLSYGAVTQPTVKAASFRLHIRAGNKAKGLHYLRKALQRARAWRQTPLVESLERDLKTLEPKQ